MNAFKKILRGVFGFYEAARSSTWRSYLPGALQSADLDISKWTREEIMRKARFFEKNNAIARRLGHVHCDFTVGATGLIFTPSSSDAKWNAAASDYLDKTLSVLDLTGRQNWGSMQQLVAWREAFDGDVFLIKTRGQDNSGKFWPRIQVLEAHLCKTPPSMISQEGKTIVDGVAIDGVGRPVGYWFEDGGEFKFYESKSVIHIFDSDRAGAKRGLSAFTAAMIYLQRLLDLQELEFRSASDGAEKSTFIKTANGQVPAGLAGRFGVAGATPVAGQSIAERETAMREAIGGRLVSLNSTDEISQFAPVRPTEATRYLWSYLTTCACTAFGVSKVVAFSEWLDSKAQGTTVRGDYYTTAQSFKAKSAVYASAFQEVIIYILSWGIATEKNLADPPHDWTKLKTQTPRGIDVDVLRNASAQQADLKLGLTTHEQIYGSLGLDAKSEVSRQIAFLAFVKKKCAEVSASEGVEVTAAEVLGELITGAQPQIQQTQTTDTTLP